VDAGCYDGGNPGIPGDITGTVGRVVLVGAGITGLATANALIHTGVECVVPEARRPRRRAPPDSGRGGLAGRYGRVLDPLSGVRAESGVIEASHAVLPSRSGCSSRAAHASAHRCRPNGCRP
jgi:2-polyprenyl-6-methoxyphenol hydroxylase-like FAD-dependent oxidoreductase